MKNETPIARFENIIVQELPDEALVYDTATNRMFCLNQTAAEVWKLADGTRNIKEISRLLSIKFHSNVGDELVSFALMELSKENLLAGKMPVIESFKHLSRREVIRRVGLASMVALPLISSLTMPKAIHAASNCVPDENNEVAEGCACGGAIFCSTGCCDTQTSVCLPQGSSGCLCFSNFDCNSDCCDGNNNVCSDDLSTCSCAAQPGRPGCPCTDGSQCDVGCCTGTPQSPGVCASGC
jgi:Coenzyme PQQ synthesis protein D (PqqD)